MTECRICRGEAAGQPYNPEGFTVCGDCYWIIRQIAKEAIEAKIG